MSAAVASTVTRSRGVAVICCNCNHTWQAHLAPRQPARSLECPHCRARDAMRKSEARVVFVTVH